MITHLLEQQTLRDFDSIHAQLHQFKEYALDQVDMLANQVMEFWLKQDLDLL